MSDRDRRSMPTLRRMAAFRTRAALLQARRAAVDLLGPRVTKHPSGGTMAADGIVAEVRTPLRTDVAASERGLVAGKIQNLRVALRRLDGVEVPAGEVFSFWAQLGRATRSKGYVKGRELREGCLIPAIGGGLCQLSGALYGAALDARFEIVERHAHTQTVPGSAAESNRDATIFWNYVDLRFRSAAPFRIEAGMDAETLTIRFRSPAAARVLHVPPPELHVITQASKRPEPQSCLSCGVAGCARHVKPPEHARTVERTAFLVDEYWPEHDAYIAETKGDEDLLLLPIDGRRYRKENYAWSSGGFGGVGQRRLLTVVRSMRSRKLAAQGAARQRALLAACERLASSYARSLSFDVTHLVVAQPLLPYLWRDGHLGGRTFDVLMTSLPIAHLHARLDMAAGLHPECRTLADFRAEESLVRAEDEALRHARTIVTPHAEIAALFGRRSRLLDWTLPVRHGAQVRNRGANRTILFPATTLGRKGAYELREAVHGLDVGILTTGANLEGDDFWAGLRVRRVSWEEGIASASAVVLPAFVEQRPRRLLDAIARGVPVIASEACGLHGLDGATVVPTGNTMALRSAISAALAIDAGS